MIHNIFVLRSFEYLTKLNITPCSNIINEITVIYNSH